MLQVDSLHKTYRDLVALENVSFSIGEGGVVGFLGPNGAGKSTTMNIIVGYTSCDSGTVRVGGCDIREDPIGAKAKIGYLPERPPLYPGMTIEEYLLFVSQLKKAAPKEGLDRHLLSICRSLGLLDVRGRVIGNLSKGYQQRVGFAQALVGFPPLLILDEPTVGLDPAQIADVRRLILELGKRHTVILSSHILSEIQAVCDRVLIIDGGRLKADTMREEWETTLSGGERIVLLVEGAPDVVRPLLAAIPGVEAVRATGQRQEQAREYTLEGKGGAGVRKAVFFRLAEAGLPLLSMHGRKDSLETIFLRVTRADAERGDAV